MGECFSCTAGEVGNNTETTIDPLAVDLQVSAHSSTPAAARRQRRKSSKDSAARRSSRGSTFSSTVAAAWSTNLPTAHPSFTSRGISTDNPFELQQRLESLRNPTNFSWNLPTTIHDLKENDDQVEAESFVVNKNFVAMDTLHSDSMSDVIVVNDESEIVF